MSRLRPLLALCLLAVLLMISVTATAATEPPLPAEATTPPTGPQLALVAQDRIALRAAARDSAQQHALLWAGEVLEVRGERLDWLQVWDHHRERAGFVRAAQVRLISSDPEHAAELMAVLRFLRDLPGSEALGVGYAAAFLRAAPAEAIDAEVFDALGTLADRLLRRASNNRNRALDEALAAQIDVLRSHGLGVLSYEHDQRMQLCYEGDAFRRVMALQASAMQQARAALALTRPECVDPTLNPLARHAHDAWRAEVLDRVPAAALPVHWQNRLRLRIASVWSTIAHNRSRRGEDAQSAAQRALDTLASVDRALLAEEDLTAYSEAAVRLGASRWAAETPAPSAKGLTIRTSVGKQPGETCIALVDTARKAEPVLHSHCTFATVWPGSARANPQGTLLTLAAQPLAGWRELWVFQRGDDGWRVDVIPPAAEGPDLGYIEFAGWVPGKRKLLAAREARVKGRFERSFELIELDQLRVEKRAAEPEHLSTFYRWQDPAWKRLTVSLR
jgi:hypothetical protein